jgi:hypothetical protein
MSRRWENKEIPGRGTKYCLVIDPEDGTHPIRTYGWSVEDVLDKVANTAETAQQVINRHRASSTSSNSTSAPARSEPAPVATPRPISAEEQMQATSDLTNPSKAPQAVKTLLRGVGLDVDKLKQDEDIRRIAAVAQEWERQHPDFPGSDRNNRLLLDKATLMVGFPNITAAALDAAYQQLLNLEMLFEVESPPESTTESPPAASNGNSGNRARPARTATSYRATSLRSDAGVTVKPKYTRLEIDALNSRQLREKIEHEPGFKDWYDREFSGAATA